MTDQELAHSRDVATGVLQGRVQALEERVSRNETVADARLAQMDAKLDTILGQMNSWRGQQLLLLWAIAPISGVIGWVASKLLPVGGLH